MRAAPLTALAIGDAKGAPFETSSKIPDSTIDERLASWRGEYRASRGGWHDLEAGQWTDDTQMSVALTRAILEAGRYDPQVAAKHYLAWFRSGKARGIGGTVKRAMEALDRGVAWQMSGITSAEGNGAAMRAAPLGVFYRHNIQELCTAARIDAKITHSSPNAEDGSVAVALAVAHLLSRGAKGEMIQFICKHLRSDSEIRRRLEMLSFMKTVEEARTRFGSGGHVNSTVPLAMACFLLTDGFSQAIEAAVRCKGDADTTAAITGAMVGSAYGYDAIPTKDIEGLEDASELRKLEIALMLQ